MVEQVLIIEEKVHSSSEKEIVFCVRAAAEWTRTPLTIRNQGTYSLFKSALTVIHLLCLPPAAILQLICPIVFCPVLCVF